jgi:hypothetical protein
VVVEQLLFWDRPLPFLSLYPYKEEIRRNARASLRCCCRCGVLCTVVLVSPLLYVHSSHLQFVPFPSPYLRATPSPFLLLPLLLPPLTLIYSFVLPLLVFSLFYILFFFILYFIFLFTSFVQFKTRDVLGQRNGIYTIRSAGNCRSGILPGLRLDGGLCKTGWIPSCHIASRFIITQNKAKLTRRTRFSSLAQRSSTFTKTSHSSHKGAIMHLHCLSQRGAPFSPYAAMCTIKRY